LDPSGLDLLWVENVGNLVCPAEFEVGEHLKVALLSVTEGDDKPLKYPVMFREADCVLITKIDLLPYLPIDVDKLENHIHQVNPCCSIFRLSASSGEGFAAWHQWLRQRLEINLSADPMAKTVLTDAVSSSHTGYKKSELVGAQPVMAAGHHDP
jgi:hydrogenase nickel incorporation protein HypB